MKRPPYPTDITDTQWAVLEPEIPTPRPGGRPRKTDMREVVNALFYLTHEGCTWRALPHDFPPWRTVYNYFDAWMSIDPNPYEVTEPELLEALTKPVFLYSVG